MVPAFTICPAWHLAGYKRVTRILIKNVLLIKVIHCDVKASPHCLQASRSVRTDVLLFVIFNTFSCGKALTHK